MDAHDFLETVHPVDVEELDEGYPVDAHQLKRACGSVDPEAPIHVCLDVDGVRHVYEVRGVLAADDGVVMFTTTKNRMELN